MYGIPNTTVVGDEVIERPQFTLIRGTHEDYADAEGCTGVCRQYGCAEEASALGFCEWHAAAYRRRIARFAELHDVIVDGKTIEHIEGGETLDSAVLQAELDTDHLLGLVFSDKLEHCRTPIAIPQSAAVSTMRLLSHSQLLPTTVQKQS